VAAPVIFTRCVVSAEAVDATAMRLKSVVGELAHRRACSRQRRGGFLDGFEHIADCAAEVRNCLVNGLPSFVRIGFRRLPMQGYKFDVFDKLGARKFVLAREGTQRGDRKTRDVTPTLSDFFKEDKAKAGRPSS